MRSRQLSSSALPEIQQSLARPSSEKLNVRVAVIGCGLIGHKRAKSLLGLGHTLVAAADILPQRATQLASAYPGCEAATDWREAITRADVEAVVVATTNNALAEVALEAVRAGKHV